LERPKDELENGDLFVGVVTSGSLHGAVLATAPERGQRHADG